MAECAWCSVPFEVTPDSFVEVGVTMDHATEAEVNEMEEGTCFLTPAMLEEMTPEQLALYGIDEDARQAMLKAQVGDSVELGAVMVCPKCLEAWQKGEVDRLPS